MNWRWNPYQSVGSDPEDWSVPPSGGYSKLVVLGVLLPLLIAAYGAQNWIDQEAIWFGSGRSRVKIVGSAAQALAVVYMSASAFCHVRWFWGLLGFERVWRAGTVMSLLGVLGGIGSAFVMALA